MGYEEARGRDMGNRTMSPDMMGRPMARDKEAEVESESWGPTIIDLLAMLEKHFGALREEWDMLTDRIAPVLRAETPSASDSNAKAVDPPIGLGSEVSQVIRDLTRGVEQTSRRIQATRLRIDL